MLRPAFTALAAVLVLSLLLSAQGAEAARGWCFADPVVVVDGQLADVYVRSDLAMLLSATGPIQLVIEVPVNSTARVLLNDLGFGRGYAITVARSASLTKTSTHTQIRVRVYAPARSSALPVTVTFAPRALSAGLTAILFGTSASGTANTWVTLRV
jgi:hypothetical protein